MVTHKEIPKRPVFIRGTEPIGMDAVPGKYFWCACGRSRNAPFCDGSHHKTGIRPVRVVIEEPGEVWWCNCKHTSSPPWCDGTHHNLKGMEGRLADE